MTRQQGFQTLLIKAFDQPRNRIITPTSDAVGSCGVALALRHRQQHFGSDDRARSAHG